MANWDINVPIDRARMFVGGEPLSGEIQLDILKQHGLKPHHKLLEVGSGAGHLAKQVVQYLDVGNYYGIEPNQWTMEENKKWDPSLAPLLEEKQARFDSNDQFNFGVFGEEFDFIFSHSILSHASVEQMREYFQGVSDHLKTPDGIALASLHYAEECEESSEWQYPGISWFKKSTLEEEASQKGMNLEYRPDIKEYYMSRREDDWHDWCQLTGAN